MMTPAKYIEKKRIRKTGNFLGLSEILGMAVAYIVIFAIELIAMLCNVSYNTILSFPFEMFVQMLYSFFCCVVPFLLCAKLLHFRVGDLVPLKRTKPALTALLVILAMGFSILGSYVSSLLDGFLSIFGEQAKMPELTQPTDPMGLILSLLVIAVAPALMEEFAFRGIILGSLRRFGDGFAIFISALMFGMFHGNLVQIPSAFIMGLALGFITVVSGSMWPAVLAHFLNNALATVLPLMYEGLPDQFAATFDMVLALLIMACGLAALILLLVLRPERVRWPKPTTHSGFFAKLGWFLSAPMVLIALLTNILLIVFVQLVY